MLGRRITAPAVVGLLLVMAGMACSSALALGTPKWQVTAFPVPSPFVPGTEDRYAIDVVNAGGVPTNGGTITVTDTLSPGVAGVFRRVQDEREYWACAGLTCTSQHVFGPMEQQSAPLRLLVEVGPNTPAGTRITNTVTVSGGGAPTTRATQVTEVTSTPAPFGVSGFGNIFTDLDGEPDTQAGNHPNGLDSSIGVTTNPVARSYGELQQNPVQDWKDIVVDLPPGVAGNPEVAPQCPFGELLSGYNGIASNESLTSNCPPSSQVGTLNLGLHGTFSGFSSGVKVYNMVPEGDEPAEFAFNVGGVPLGIYPTVIGNGAGAHIRVTTPGIPFASFIPLMGVDLRFFGDPNEQVGGETGVPNAFFTNSSDCAGGPLVSTVHVDSYEDPGRWVADNPSAKGTLNFTDGTADFSDPAWKGASYTSPAVTGCEKLHFDPSMAIQPETKQADEPTGLAVKLSIPQNPDAHGLATPPFKSVKVTLPAGMSLSPSAADGLQACSEAQFEPQSNIVSSCPNASVLGTVTVSTPLLPGPLTGYVFLGQPGCDPCSDQDAADGNMFRLLIQVEGFGVVQKVQGTVAANTTTGQLTATFPDNPQFPVSGLQLAFKGGLRAGLATPQSCGEFTSTSDMVPWSTPYTPDATPSSSFDVSLDGQGGACPAAPPLTPSFSAGTSNPNAGQLSPLTLTFAREDRQQDLSQISVATPPGLLGTLTGVPLCGEPQAAQGTCPEASQIGKMTVAAGPGGHPFYTQGRIYLTGSYKGAPFGLSIVVPTKAGPFDLGNVVVRSQIVVDPNTSALTVTSDPFPQILDGIPLRLRTANVTIDRPGFIFNPTNCAQQRISATIVGVQGASANVSSPFAVSGCAGLHFGPKFTVSTSGRTSKANGASLDARLVFPTSAGAQSNIAHVRVELPKRLPSRLTTLQKACPEATFAANPANCPAPSAIGIAKTITPVLPVPLEGPVYFVSRGGAAFPNLVVVLQGYGVRVDLTATTFISKAGVTSSTFDSIPDVPVNSFELYLPQGPYSALAANGNLCTGSTLAMPTSFIAQDGARLEQNTKIAVTGCPKAKPARRAKARRARRASKASNRNAGHERSR
ncbi:MAG: hypothetical protein ACRDLF_06760 [Solirubrobacteraceae bacterium]